MTPICEYLVSGLLPEDPKEARKIRVKAPLYKLIRGSLYRRSLYTTWLRCVAPPQTDDIVKEIHKGSCGFNIEPRSMVLKESDLLKWDQQAVSKLVTLRNFARRYGSRFYTHGGCAKQLLEVVEKRFGGNAATKKTQRNILKQQYENFTTSIAQRSLIKTFDRLSKACERDEFANKPVVENYKAISSEEEPKEVRNNDDAPIIEE
ncbi:hypothetical protein Tco_0194218 [Tanacetum coccineum]